MSRPLFEQPLDSNPSDLTYRVAFGKASNFTKNMTLTSLITWLNAQLGFNLKSNNLSDVPNKVTGRSNLGVYSTSEVDADLALKADKSNVLQLDNTATYTPSSNYHPATKKYVDDNSIISLFNGYTDLGDISGFDERTITLSPVVGTSNYMVIGNLVDLETGASPHVQNINWGTRLHASGSFRLVMEEISANTQNLRFYFILVSNSGFTSCPNS